MKHNLVGKENTEVPIWIHNWLSQWNMLLIMGVPFQLSCSHVLNSIQPALASGVSNNRNFFIYQLPGFLTRWKTVHNLPANAGVQFSSVTQSYPVLCDSMNRSTPGLPVHHQLPEFTQTHPLSQWCHLTITSSVVPFSSCPQSFPTLGSFQMSQLFASGGQNIEVSASTSVLPMNTQDWFYLDGLKERKV